MDLLRELQKHRAGAAIEPTPQPLPCELDGLLSLLVKVQLGHGAQDPICHPASRAVRTNPPLAHALSTEQVYLRKPVHLRVLAEHGTSDRREGAGQRENDEWRCHGRLLGPSPDRLRCSQIAYPQRLL